jgi:hypothetical protein
VSERIQSPGATSIASAADVAEDDIHPPAPRAVESLPGQVRTNEFQVWFLARHLIGVRREHADQLETAQKLAGMRSSQLLAVSLES